MRAIVVALWIGCVVSSLAQNCVINVNQDMVQRLVSVDHPTQLSCDTLWNSVAHHLTSTRRNLSACEAAELTVNLSAEPSVADCQQTLDDGRQIAEANARAYTGGMQRKIQQSELDTKTSQREVMGIHNQITRVTDELKSSYRTLVLLNVRAGASKQALKYYHRYLEGHQPGRLLNAIIDAVYKDPEHETERFEYLLDFARKLPGKSLRISFYKLINEEMQKHPAQRDSYLAMIATLDLGKVLFSDDNYEARNLYNDMFRPALKLLRDAVLAGSYDEIVTFASKYPDHFEQIENQLSTLETAVWHRVNFDEFVTYPNRLPLARQRLEAFRMILLQINQHNKSNFAERLVKVAREVDQCETFLKDGKNEQADQQKLATVKQLFAKRDSNRDYDHYLKESKKEQERSEM
uniref:Uncharacterized protein n=1 Tax=Anopheles epiroticus TaxID=199890 RepID=A0A240PL33_9DIPT